MNVIDDTTTHRKTNDYTSADAGPVKMVDNYITLDPEHPYASLNSNDDISESHKTVNKEQKDDSSSITEGEAISHDYFILSADNAYSYAGVVGTNSAPNDNKEKGSYIASETTGVEGKVGIQSKKHSSESHNYFVLEPQNLNTSVVLVTSLETHEHQSLREQKNKVDDQGQPTIDGQGYPILAPEDIYNTIDPDDVVIQTLPDNEYNVVGIKRKKAVQDKNYDILKPVDGTQDNDEYSHTSDFQTKANE